MLKQPPFPLDAGEVMLATAGANLFRGREAVGGWLWITNRRLLFAAHALNIQTEPEAIALGDIVAVEKCNSLGLVPNGMMLRLRSGERRQFVVWHRDRLMACIRDAASL